MKEKNYTALSVEGELFYHREEWKQEDLLRWVATKPMVLAEGDKLQGISKASYKWQPEKHWS